MKKLCVECKHYGGKTSSGSEHFCNFQTQEDYCRVTGKTSYVRGHCHAERSPQGLCKAEGVNFEQAWRYSVAGKRVIRGLKGLVFGLAIIGLAHSFHGLPVPGI